MTLLKLVRMKNRGDEIRCQARTPSAATFLILTKCRPGSVNLHAQLGLITAAAASPARRIASATLKGAGQQASKNT